MTSILYVMVRKGFIPGVLILISFFPLSCSSHTRQPGGDKASLIWSGEKKPSLSVVVLPFENHTSEEDLEKLVRESFYNHLSSKDFRDLEMRDVDRALQNFEQKTSKKWKELSASHVGDILHADLMVYGRVISFKKYFLGIYSQIAITVELEMVHCKREETVWRRTMTKRSHEGGIPFELFGLIPATLRSGYHMKKEMTIALVDGMCRELVEEIPGPPHPPLSSSYVEIQVASFGEKEPALKVLEELEARGYYPRIEQVRLGDRIWHRILLGPYYLVSEAEHVRSQVEGETTYRPIFVHHSPGRKEKGQP